MFSQLNFDRASKVMRDIENSVRLIFAKAFFAMRWQQRQSKKSSKETY